MKIHQNRKQEIIMSFQNLDGIPEVEFIPGYFVKFIHTEKMTLAYWRIVQGAALPEHSHFHEQATNVLEGEFQLTVDGEAQVLRLGQVAVIPPDVRHSGVALTNCRILDVFAPVREDYRNRK